MNSQQYNSVSVYKQLTQMEKDMTRPTKPQERPFRFSVNEVENGFLIHPIDDGCSYVSRHWIAKDTLELGQLLQELHEKYKKGELF